MSRVRRAMTLAAKWGGVHSPATMTAVTLLALAGIGVADYYTSSALLLSGVYVAPVALAAWMTGRPGGLLLAVMAAPVWLFASVSSVHWHWSGWVPYASAALQLLLFCMVAVLVAALRDVLRRQRQLATHDALTGLPNLRGLTLRAQGEIANARRHSRPLGAAYVDIDRFKLVNDTLGHAAGDHLLVELGKGLRQATRSGDVVARLGGDEFLVLLPSAEAAAAASVAEKITTILQRVCEQTLSGVGASVGVAVFPRPPEDLDAVIHAADAAMYGVKRAGKGTWRVVTLSETCDVVEEWEAADQ